MHYEGFIVSDDTLITVAELTNYPYSFTEMDTLPLTVQGISAGTIDYGIHPKGDIDILWILNDPNDFNPWELQIIVNLYFWQEYSK